VALGAHDDLVSGRQGPQGEEEKMKKSLLAIALVLGVSSLTFTAVAAPQDTPPTQKDTTKKSKSKKKKAPKKTTGGSSATNPSK
jgi:hypothetical protein